jgi:CheY-like chemotaxis protein
VKILIADDDRISRLILESTLADWGHEVVAVADGPSALEALSAADAPRLAILDWRCRGWRGRRCAEASAP